MELREDENEEATWKLIGLKLYWLRKRVNMPIFQFAERLDIPEDKYVRLETGNPDPELLAKLSRYYGLSLRWFYDPRATGSGQVVAIRLGVSGNLTPRAVAR